MSFLIYEVAHSLDFHYSFNIILHSSIPPFIHIDMNYWIFKFFFSYL